MRKVLSHFFKLFIIQEAEKQEEEQNYSTNRDDYKLGEFIYKSVTGTTKVQKAIYKKLYCNDSVDHNQNRNKKCAVKRINLSMKNKTFKEVENEAAIMSKCDHKNITKFYQSFVVYNEFWIVLELLERRSLSDIIELKLSTSLGYPTLFDEPTIATVMKEVLIGMEYLHNDIGIIHRDLKCSNILFSLNGRVLIGDFGASTLLFNKKFMFGRQQQSYDFVGSPWWMAPEVIRPSNGYNFLADIWSFGITAIEMATSAVPYQEFLPYDAHLLILKYPPPTLETCEGTSLRSKGFGKEFRSMIATCLKKNPYERPTASQLLYHEFFNKAKDRTYLLEMFAQLKWDWTKKSN